MSSDAQTHPFHMVDPSSWPFVGSIAAFTTAVGAIMYMHGAPLLTTVPGFALIAYTF